MEKKRYSLKLGDEIVFLDVSYWKQSHILYLNLHENEQTSVSASKEVVAKKAGVLAELKSKKERLISFKRNGTAYVFDPNRMFSAAGIKASLEENSSFNEDAAAGVSLFAKDILNKIKSYDPAWIVALHNTSGEYSIEGYVKGGPYEKDAADLFINDKQARGDFFFTSDNEAFRSIKKKGYNVVLQNNIGVNDDGSLSVYCGKNGIRYINCEALHGHIKEQVEMLGFIHTLI